jgi:uncharacterized protein (TIGR02246 family)
MPRARSFLVPLVALSAIFITTSCGSASDKDAQAQHERDAQQTRAADEAAIRANSIAWSQAATAKDLDKVISFYADDAVELPNQGPAAKGKENIRKTWGPLISPPGPGLSWKTSTVEVAHSGELAYETGNYNFVTIDKKGKTNDLKGKYVVVWKKQSDGSWKVVVDTDNTDQ